MKYVYICQYQFEYLNTDAGAVRRDGVGDADVQLDRLHDVAPHIARGHLGFEI